MNFLSNKNVYIYEEGSYIELFNQNTYNSLIDNFIYIGLTSMNPGVINAACLLIRNLYFYQIQKIPELIGTMPDIFNVLQSILLEKKDMKEVHLFILRTIADIFLIT